MDTPPVRTPSDSQTGPKTAESRKISGKKGNEQTQEQSGGPRLDSLDQPLVRLKNVSMRYGSGEPVLRDMSFSLKAGDFRFLTGPSGAGKSSLLRLLYLAHRPSEGTIEMFGRDLSEATREDLPDMRRRIGVVFQDYRLLDHMTSFENVALPLRILGRRLEDYRDDVVELLTWVGLGNCINERPTFLSGGEKQRVAIARAIVAKPDLLLADEPTGNLDAEIGMRLMRLFVELNRLGTTIVIATHDRYLVEAVGAQELFLEDGRVISRGAHGDDEPEDARTDHVADRAAGHEGRERGTKR